jgi:hypothetical protein
MRTRLAGRDPVCLLILGSRLDHAKFADLVDEKIEGSRLDDKIQSSRSPQSAPINEG